MTASFERAPVGEKSPLAYLWYDRKVQRCNSTGACPALQQYIASAVPDGHGALLQHSEIL